MTAAVRPIDGATCLVTGGAGYLGRNLVAALRARGCEVVVLDPAEASFDDPKVRLVRGDLRDVATLDTALRGVDVVFHTAALIELARYAPAEVAARVRGVNVDGTRTLLERAEAAGVTRFVQTSSTATVLTDGNAGSDESQPYSAYPNLYTTTKVAAEKLVRGHRGAMQTCSLRPGGIYGPGERNQLVAPTLTAIAQGNPITIIGDGSSRLDYTHIESLVDAHLRAADRLLPGSPVAGSAYFVSDGQPINHGEFTRRLFTGLGMSLKVRYVSTSMLLKVAYLAERAYERFGKKPAVSMGQVDTCARDNWFSIAAARRDLDYVPKYDTDAGIRTMLPDVEAYIAQTRFVGR